MTLNEIFEAAAKYERDLENAWNDVADYGTHIFSYELDDEVMRCEDCGMNRLALRDHKTCDDYMTWRSEENFKLRVRAGIY